MSSRYSRSVLIATIFVVMVQELTFSASATEVAINNKSLWSEINHIVAFLFDKCLAKHVKGHNQLHRNDKAAPILGDCLKRRGLRALDRALDRDVIEITDNVVLVKWKNDTEHNGKDDRSWRERKRKSHKFNMADDLNRDLSEKIVQFLKTRIVRITFKGFNRTTVASEARHRHKNNMFGQMMMFGMVAAGLIVVPMGFQFLAVLGGKALLLAKLALLLTSIQGLKKIATSHVNYGLYSTGHGGPCKSIFECRLLLYSGGYGTTGYYGDVAREHLNYYGEGFVDGEGNDDDVDLLVSLDIDADALLRPAVKWHYDRQWHQEADPYPTTFHPSAIGAPLGHDLYSSNIPPIYNTLHPRGENYLAT